MSEHELLIRHARTWATKKKRPLDADLLETVLDLRSYQDEESPNRSPAGSIDSPDAGALAVARPRGSGRRRAGRHVGRGGPDAGRRRTGDSTLAAHARAGSQSMLRQSLHFFEDCGIWVRRDDTFELTDLGRIFGAGVLVGLLEGDLSV